MNPSSPVENFRQQFIEFTLTRGVLRFGEFQTKAGRLSPYFFNTGLFNDGQSLLELAGFYAQAIIASQLEFDVLFGPAYKGIPLVAATSMALAQMGHNYTFAYNRKEAKDHGEGGVLIGAALTGRVLIVDDVISAGTSARESVEIIREAGGVPAGMVIALDRMERGLSSLSAVEEVTQNFAIPVIPVATLEDLLGYLDGHPALAEHRDAVADYRARYGIGSV